MAIFSCFTKSIDWNTGSGIPTDLTSAGQFLRSVRKDEFGPTEMQFDKKNRSNFDKIENWSRSHRAQSLFVLICASLMNVVFVKFMKIQNIISCTVISKCIQTHPVPLLKLSSRNRVTPVSIQDAVTSALAWSFLRYWRGVSGDIGDCGVAITPQMWSY